VEATKISSQCHIGACHPILLFYEIAHFQLNLKPISATVCASNFQLKQLWNLGFETGLFQYSEAAIQMALEFRV
jgi:hypothetical protein